MREAPSGRLELSVEQRAAAGGQVAIVRARGEVDLGNADDLAGVLRSNACVQSDGIVLDLVGVPFMDSSGLRAVLVASGELETELVVVASPGSPVRRLFELAEVTDRMAFFATEHEAIEAVGDGTSSSG